MTEYTNPVDRNESFIESLAIETVRSFVCTAAVSVAMYAGFNGAKYVKTAVGNRISHKENQPKN